MQEKKISVIIPCFNMEPYLERCFASLTRQTIGLSSLECIFVNDASTDDGKTIEKLHEIEQRAPESVMVIDLTENMGPGEARNIGLEYATGKYIQFFDADDELDDDALRLLYEIAEKNKADIVQYNHLFILGDQRKSSGNVTENKLYVIETKEDRIPFLNTSKGAYGCTSKFMRTDLIRMADVKFPARMKYEEPLFIYPLYFYATRIYMLNRDLYFYYFRPGSMITSELGKKLTDHPKVQLMLLEYCLSNPGVFSEYREVFIMYFLWTFYLETISFAGSYKDACIPLEFFEFMQNVCRTYCGDFRDNKYVMMIPESGRKVLESIDHEFKDQKELNEFFLREKDCI